MLCGGHGEILVDLLDAAEPGTVAAFTAAAGALARREPAWLLTALDPPAGAPAAGRHGLLRRDAAGVGAVPEQAAAWTRGPEAHGIRVETAGGRRVLVEPLPRAGRVLVFGAGHCAQRLAPLAASVGFEVAVLDDRAEFLRPALFPAEVEQVPLASFERLPELGIDEDTYVVIVTRGHLHDLVVLEQCLRTRAGYLGMIGSVRKRDKVYAALRARGAVPAGLERVHSPIGVEIDAETPEEIAVSIVGELILARAAQRRSSRT